MSKLVPAGAKLANVNRRRLIKTVLVNIIALLMIVAGLRAMLTYGLSAMGVRDMQEENYVNAKAVFSANRVANWYQPWLAHYNYGVSLFELRLFPEAADAFQKALPLTPDAKHCQVALNLAWSLESYGDERSYDKDYKTALQLYIQAEQVAKEGKCDYQGAAGKIKNEEGGDKQQNQSNDKGEQGQNEDKDKAENNQSNSDSDSNSNSDKESEESKSGQSMKDQQEQTEKRNQQKAENAQAQMKSSQQQSGGQEQKSDAQQRKQEMEQRNLQGQQQNMDRIPQISEGHGSPGNGEDGQPTW